MPKFVWYISYSTLKEMQRYRAIKVPCKLGLEPVDVGQLIFDEVDVHSRGVDFLNQIYLFYGKRLMFWLHFSLPKLSHDVDLSKSLALLESLGSQIFHSDVTPNPVELPFESFLRQLFASERLSLLENFSFTLVCWLLHQWLI